MIAIVDVLMPGKIDFNGQKCMITTMEAAGFLLTAGEEPVATCTNAARLASFAFEHGALEVRHAYDASKVESDSIRTKG